MLSNKWTVQSVTPMKFFYQPGSKNDKEFSVDFMKDDVSFCKKIFRNKLESHGFGR